MEQNIRPILEGRRALVVGVANDQSIAYGCAKAFHSLGAELAVTWLNEKARPHVEPLARDVGATITAPHFQHFAVPIGVTDAMALDDYPVTYCRLHTNLQREWSST